MSLTWENRDNLTAEELEELYQLEPTELGPKDSFALALLRVFAVCLCGAVAGVIWWAVMR